MPPLLTATHLVRWADDRRSQGMLPLLLRRLIVATTNPLRIDIAAGDSVNRPGYDGFLQTAAGNAFVPVGQSVWEFGVNQSPSQKAESDYKTRTGTPGAVIPAETTFVFVTPRRWQGKTDWAQEKQAQRVWADVRVYDADDLEQWLEQAPPTAAWARRVIVGTPEGVRDVEEVWELWAARTTPPLLPALFLAGRDPAVECVRAWLTGPARSLRVRAASADEVVGFLAAVVASLPEPERERVRARALLISTADAWRAVAGQRTPVIVLAANPTLGSDALAVAQGHHVLLAYGNDAGGMAVDLDLPPLRRTPLEAALREMGLGDDRARDLAGESRGRIAAVVDLLGGGAAPPHWAIPEVAPRLTPFLLAGAWSSTPGDSDAMSRLARLSSEELSQVVSRWVNETDPPIRVVGGMWEWVSRQRAWPHLSRHITPSDLAAFGQVVANVLGERDPRFDLPAEERWMAAIRNCAPRYSEPLRRGLAEGLVLLATQSSAVRQGGDLAGLVSVLVRDAFGPAPDPGRWYSLAPLLPTLAEAAPDEFLAAVERDVLAHDEVRAVLFAEEGMFGGSRHTHLLWALETLAWSSAHLTRAASVLAVLAEQDPGGRLANRPPACLRAIFLPWRPHTMASVPQRLAAIDAIHRRSPVVAFDLCVQLLPRGYDTVTPTSRPRWRNWSVDRESGILVAEYWEAVRGVFERALRWAGEDQGRWSRLLGSVRHLPPDRVADLLTRVEGLPLETLAAQPSDDLRRAVRRVLHERRTIEGMYPDLSEEHVTSLDRIYCRLQPADLVRRHAWLFDHQPEILTVTGNDWHAEQEACEAERAAAIRDTVRTEGPAAALRLAEAVQAPWAVGNHLGRSDLTDEDITTLLADCLRVADESRLTCFQGIVAGRFRQDGWGWVERLCSTEVPQGWSAAQTAQIALALRFEEPTWDWVEGRGEEVAAEYWRQTPAHWVHDPARDAPRAIRTLLDRGRPFAAFQITNLALHGHRAVLTPDLRLSVLRAITAAATGEQPTTDTPRRDGGLGYHVGELLTAVEEDGLADEAELARIEWVWSPALEHTRRGVRTLCGLLARDPHFFATLVNLVYRPRVAEGEREPATPPSDLDRQRAELAWRLLHEWRGFPGRTESGQVDEDALRGWVTTAREALARSGHAVIGDQEIGAVLARAPAGADETWPHECVRSLLEELASEDLETGVSLGVMNGRGVTCRAHDTGGEPERRLAEQYAAWAAAVAASAPRTARILRQLGDRYGSEARREDDRRDLNEYSW